MTRKITHFIFIGFALAGCKPTEQIQNLGISQFAVPPDTMTLEIDNYQPQPGNVHQNIFVSNFSVSVSQGQLLYSTARDMADSLKLQLNKSFGFSLQGPESSVNGIADLMIYQAGLDLTQQGTLLCASALMGVSANDGLFYNDKRQNNIQTLLGLRDCAKIYIGLDPNLFSYNGSGLPDYLQMRCGMNPLNKNTPYVSTAGDGIKNMDKCKLHIPIDESAGTQANQIFAYNYANIKNKDGSVNFVTSNIPILNQGQDNFLAVYIVESNPTTKKLSLYTAYSVLPGGFANKTLKVNYWATKPSNFYEFEIVP